MGANQVSERLKRLMSALLKVPEAEITETTSNQSLETWDSIAHMHLMLAIEEEFGIEFSDDEIGASVSFTLLKDVIARRAK